MRQKKVNQASLILERVTYIYAILMIGIYPLYYQNNYIDIVRAKRLFFLICTTVYLSISLLFVLLEWSENKEKQYNRKSKKRKKHIQYEEQKKDKPFLHSVKVYHAFAILFILVILLSTIMSDSPREVWWGKEGRRTGAMVYLMCLGICYMMSRYFRPGKIIKKVFLLANSLVFLLGILNFWGIDILHMYDNLAKYHHNYFFSTIGNINVSSAYVCLILPIAMVLYYLCKEKKEKIVYAIFLTIGFLYAYMTVSDSWILGIGTAYIVLLWFSLWDNQRRRNYLELIAIFLFSSVLLKIMLKIAAAWKLDSPMLQSFHELNLQNYMTNGYVLMGAGLCLAFAALGLIWLQAVSKKKEIFNLYKWKKYILSTIIVAILAGILLVLIANLGTKTTWRGNLSWLNQLKISDEFGSKRGFIWRITVEDFSKLSPVKQLFGCGLNNFRQFSSINDSAEGMKYLGGTLVDAHSEYLQYLVTVGVLGCLAYFGMLISIAVKTLKASDKNPILMIGMVVVLCHFAQGMVNSPQIADTPLLFLFLGILLAKEARSIA